MGGDSNVPLEHQPCNILCRQRMLLWCIFHWRCLQRRSSGSSAPCEMGWPRRAAYSKGWYGMPQAYVRQTPACQHSSWRTLSKSWNLSGTCSSRPGINAAYVSPSRITKTEITKWSGVTVAVLSSGFTAQVVLMLYKKQEMHEGAPPWFLPSGLPSSRFLSRGLCVGHTTRLWSIALEGSCMTRTGSS